MLSIFVKRVALIKFSSTIRLFFSVLAVSHHAPARTDGRAVTSVESQVLHLSKASRLHMGPYLCIGKKPIFLLYNSNSNVDDLRWPFPSRWHAACPIELFARCGQTEKSLFGRATSTVERFTARSTVKLDINTHGLNSKKKKKTFHSKLRIRHASA